MTSEYDYEAILNEYQMKGLATDQVENLMKSLDAKRWAALSNYYEAKTRFELAENKNNKLKILLAEKAKIRKSLDLDHAFFDEKINRLRKLHMEMQIKGQNEMETFFNTMDELYQEFQRLPAEFENENMHQQLRNYTESLKLLEQKIAFAKKNMVGLEEFIKSTESIDDADMLNVKEVTEAIQKESFDKYGDPNKCQSNLADMRRNIELLSKKIQETKVKYDV